jgi:hypothetical protein
MKMKTLPPQDQASGGASSEQPRLVDLKQPQRVVEPPTSDDRLARGVVTHMLIMDALVQDTSIT